MDKYIKTIESLPETDQTEFYQILADADFTEKQKEILIISRLKQIIPTENTADE